MTTAPSKGRSLTWRVLLVLSLAAIVPTVTVGTIAIWRMRANLQKEVVRGHLALVRELGASLDGRLQGARRVLDLAAAAWADERTTDAPPGGDDDAANQRLIRRLRREVPLFANIAIFDVTGAPIAGDQVAIGAGAGKHTFGGYIGDVTFADGKPRVRVVTQARSRTGELVGIFVAHLDLGFIADALGQARLGEGAQLIVVDGEGVPIARSDGAAVAGAGSLRGQSDAVDRALGEATEGSVERGGVVAVYRNLSTYQTLRGVRWAIILEQPERDAYALAHETTRNTIIGALAALAVALVVGFALATRLTRPLHALALRADEIAGEGDTESRAPIAGPGEIGMLAGRLEQMAQRLGERERLKEALARGDRLAAVGTMSASIAHEINNPLTTVLGYANLLLEDKADDHPDRTGLRLIADEAARMQEIVRGLLDYSRAETETTGEPSLEPVDVNAAVEHTAALVGPSLKRQRVSVDLQLSTPLPRAVAEAHAVQQVFVNLVHNAAQAMTDGGSLTIKTELGPGSTAVHVLFTDTGPGVPMADRERIFDPFFTTKGAGAGTGLGLAVARHLVTRSGGTLGVEDGPNQRGACFRVVLPIVE